MQYFSTRAALEEMTGKRLWKLSKILRQEAEADQEELAASVLAQGACGDCCDGPSYKFWGSIAKRLPFRKHNHINAVKADDASSICSNDTPQTNAENGLILQESDIAGESIDWCVRSLLASTEVEAGEHTRLADNIRRQLCEKIEAYLRDQEIIRDRHRNAMSKATKNRTDALFALAKAKERYIIRCQEKESLMNTENALNSGGIIRTFKEQEKGESKIRKAKELEVAADAEYQETVGRVAAFHASWIEAMRECAVEFQKVEETRLWLSEQLMHEFVVLISSAHENMLNVCTDDITIYLVIVDVIGIS